MYTSSLIIGGKLASRNIKDLRNYISEYEDTVGLYIVSEHPLKDLKQVKGPSTEYYYKDTTFKKLKEISSKHNIFLSILISAESEEEAEGQEELESYLEENKINYIRETYSETIESLIIISDWAKIESKWHLNFSIPMSSFFRYMPEIDAFGADLEKKYDNTPLIELKTIEDYTPYNITIKEMYNQMQKLHLRQFHLNYLTFD